LIWSLLTLELPSKPRYWSKDRRNDLSEGKTRKKR